MSDLTRSSPVGMNIETGEDSGVSAVHATAGGLLRDAREAAGLHIAALAVALKVPVKKLEALEADRFDLLPDAVFVRALASSVCRTLKIDPGPVLQLLPQGSSPKLTYQGVGINTPFRAPNDGPGPSVWSQMSRTPVLAGVLLLLATLVIILMPVLKSGLTSGSAVTQSRAVNGSAVSEAVVVTENRGNETPAMPEAAAAREAAPAIEAKTAPTAPFSQQVAVAASAPVVPAASAAVVLAAPASSLLPASRPVATSAAASPASAAVAMPSTSSGIVVFTAKSESWVEVTDSKGQVVLRRILNAGEVAGASGVLPLAAVVGRADATTVQIRGRAFDLSAVSRDNVARFEVK